jgi:hypothetical protein
LIGDANIRSVVLPISLAFLVMPLLVHCYT